MTSHNYTATAHCAKFSTVIKLYTVYVLQLLLILFHVLSVQSIFIYCTKSDQSDLNSRHRTISLLFCFQNLQNFLYSRYNNDCRIIVQQTKLNMENYPPKYKSIKETLQVKSTKLSD